MNRMRQAILSMGRGLSFPIQRTVDRAVPRTSPVPPFLGGPTNFYRRFPGDYLRDTQHLTLAQHGIFNLLLDTLYATEKPIQSREDAYRITRSFETQSVSDCNKIIDEFFTETRHGITNKRVEEEIERANIRAKVSRENGLQGGRPKTNWVSLGLAKPNLEKSSPDSRLQTPDNANSQSKPIAQKPGESELFGFKVFWDAYPKRVGKPAARRAWLSKVKDDSRYPEVIAGLEQWKASEQWREIQFVPYPATFLNQQRWQDQVPSGGINGKSKSEERSERVRAAAEAVFGTTGPMGRALRGELRQGADRGNIPDLQDRPLRLGTKIPS